ncbi:phospholipase D-like protein [Xylophilus ampelinus]|uniref:Phospholipase D-like protein n=1 Tax=Xylophilus ampelinus TaxID=54067 RepID=A0A318SJR5_9BURK|nr:phospholipase D-like protein [Xylophilus ampelinus]
MHNWTKASGEVLHGEPYFPALQPIAGIAAGQGRVQMFSSSPSGGSESMHLMYLMAITAAQRRIDLSSAYFVPDKLTVRALVAAMRRGAQVRIVTPGPIMDAQTVRSASRALWGPLLAAGAEIREYQPTMYHCKVLIVDGLLVSVGSTNFDNRSFRLNDEANLNLYDEAFAAEQNAIFERDLAVARQLTMAQWLDRPWNEKLMERASALLAAQL